MSTITAADVQDMIGHWLSTPIGSYLGSDYGNNADELIANPHSMGLADSFIKKLINDVPVLQTLPKGTINIFGISVPPDKMRIILEVAGSEFTIN
ncbi:MAG: hypothetical protein PHU14_16860 [Methylovulum sp.]|nr:hypothetical protein [Methylovulum sp.]